MFRRRGRGSGCGPKRIWLSAGTLFLPRGHVHGGTPTGRHTTHAGGELAPSAAGTQVTMREADAPAAPGQSFPPPSLRNSRRMARFPGCLTTAAPQLSLPVAHSRCPDLGQFKRRREEGKCLAGPGGPLRAHRVWGFSFLFHLSDLGWRTPICAEFWKLPGPKTLRPGTWAATSGGRRGAGAGQSRFALPSGAPGGSSRPAPCASESLRIHLTWLYFYKTIRGDWLRPRRNPIHSSAPGAALVPGPWRRPGTRTEHPIAGDFHHPTRKQRGFREPGHRKRGSKAAQTVNSQAAPPQTRSTFTAAPTARSGRPPGVFALERECNIIPLLQ